MKIKKTVGVANDSNFNDRGYVRKDYIVHTECGKEFLAKANKKVGYICNNVSYASVKALKAAIESGSLDKESNTDGDTDGDTDGTISPTWDCVHPCALLCQLYDLGLLGPLGYKHKDVLAHFRDTMDKYGWLNESGHPDVERAAREVSRCENLLIKT